MRRSRHLRFPDPFLSTNLHENLYMPFMYVYVFHACQGAILHEQVISSVF